MNEREWRQLAALARVDASFDAARIDYWLFGGWAVDFYAGEATRPHDDVDIAVWLHDLPRIEALLDADGWTHVPSDEDDGGTGYEHDGVRLELTFLARDEEGAIFIPLRDGRVPWSQAALADDVRELLGTRSRLVTLESLRRGKSSPRDDPEDAAKDRADHGVLSDLKHPR